MVLWAPWCSATKNWPAMQETQVRSLGQEDPLEKGMATHSPASLPGESRGRGSLVGRRPWGRTESDTTEASQQPQQA